MPHPPVIFVLSGPNGAGKTTGAAVVLPTFGTHEFVNADNIQRDMGIGASPIAAGRQMLRRMHALRSAGVSFAFETTLSARTYQAFLEKAQQDGYFVHLVYIWLKNTQLAKSRVALRVKMGGHEIPLPM